MSADTNFSAVLSDLSSDDIVGSVSQAGVIDIPNIAPEITSTNTGTVDENASTDTIIYDANATDDDGDNITLSIDQTDPSDDSDKVSMNSDGEVTLNASANYESKDSYQFTVKATDGSDTVTKDVTVSVNDVDEAPIVTLTGFTPGGVDPIAHKNIPEVEDPMIENAIHAEGVAPGIVYDITDTAILDHILDRNDHGITPGSFAFDRDATHFTISKVVVTDALSANKYFVNVTDPTEDNIDVVTKYTLAQEQVLDDYLGNNATYEGIRAFSTTINADADPVDVLDTGEDIFFSLTGEHSNHFTIDNSTGEIF